MQSVLPHTRHPRAVPQRRRLFLALPPLVGGTAVALGAVLPWLTLYAGLHQVRGISGLFGQLALGAGLACVAGALTYAWRGSPAVYRGLGWLGLLLLGFASFLIFRLYGTYGLLLTQPMLVARIGPGVFVTTSGALAVAVTFFLARSVTVHLVEPHSQR